MPFHIFRRELHSKSENKSDYFFTFFSEMVWILQVFKRLWQASMHTACQSSIFCPKSQQDITKKLNFWGQKWTFDITVIQKKIFVQKIQA